MKEKKLVVQIGFKHDKYGNKLYDELGKPIPIYKEVKKIFIQYFTEDNQVHLSKSKPFWNGNVWLMKAFHKIFIIDKQNIFFDDNNKFWVLTKEVKPCNPR